MPCVGTILDAEGNVSTSSGEFKKSDLSVRPIKPTSYAFYLTLYVDSAQPTCAYPAVGVGHTGGSSDAYSFLSPETFARLILESLISSLQYSYGKKRFWWVTPLDLSSYFYGRSPYVISLKVNILHIRALVKADTVVLFDTFGSTDSKLHSVFLYHLEVGLHKPSVTA